MLTMPTAERLATDAYSDHVNPQWVKLLSLLEMNLSYERCVGTELFTADGLRILDFLSGYCVHNTGHNHPAIVSALKEELDKSGPLMLQSNASELAVNWRSGFATWQAVVSPRCLSPVRDAKASKPRSSSRERTQAVLDCFQRPRLPWPDLWRTVADER